MEAGLSNAKVKVSRGLNVVPNGALIVVESFEGEVQQNIRINPQRGLGRGCSLCETPSGRVFITGGGQMNYDIERTVLCLDLARENCFTLRTPLSVSRWFHVSFYFEGFLYVVGGLSSLQSFSLCERLDLMTEVWEHVPDLPVPAYCSAWAFKQDTKRAYLLGGESCETYQELDIVQELDLVSMKWRTLSVRLPPKSDLLVAFTYRSEVHVLLNSAVYRLDPEALTLLKTTEMVQQSWTSAHYYKGKLFFSSLFSHTPSVELDLDTLQALG
jgi:hypothetical protein